MRNLRRILAGLTAFAICAAIAGCESKDHTPNPDSTLVETLVDDSQLGAELDGIVTNIAAGKFSGAVLVAKEGTILLRKGYGAAHQKTRRPNLAGTVFDIGSLAKPMTSVVILQLVDEGKLSLDDTLAQHFDNVPEDKRAITIHQLLTHSAGTPLYHDKHGDFERLNRETAIERIFEAPLRHGPGEMYRYSNSAYTLLGAIVEDQTGMAWTDAVRARVLEPAGMTSSGFYGERKYQQSGVAHSYEDGASSGSPVSYPGPYWALIGNGGLVSNVQDLYSYYQALMDGRLLSAESRDRLLEGQISSGEYIPGRYPTIDRGRTMVSYFGWVWFDTEGRRFIEKGGAGQGYSSLLRIEPESGTVIVILSNDLVLSEEGDYLRSPLVEALHGAVRKAAAG